MSANLDPAMQELIDEFVKEANELLQELDECLENLDDDSSNTNELEKFGQIIDRIMGAAKTFQLDEIATFCELGKIIGYKSSQTKEKPLLDVVVAILFDAVDLLKKMIVNLDSDKDGGLEGLSTDAFATRLRWLSDKFKNIERASCNFDEKTNEPEMDQESIDGLLESLGL